MRTQSICLALAIVLLCPFASAQWVQTYGPFYCGQSAEALTATGTDLFVGTWGTGVFRSTDDGVRWTQVNSGLTEGCVKCFAGAGTFLFAGTWWANGVFRSTDRGATWTHVGPDNAFVYSLAADATNLYAAIWGSSGGQDLDGVFRSTDNGTTWNPTGLMFTNNSLRFTNVLSLAVSGKNLFAGTDSCVFKSTDNGHSWIPLGSSPRGVWALHVEDNTLFAGGNGVCRSTDGGASWSKPELTATGGSIVSIVATGGRVFVADTWLGAFCSTDGGMSWNAVNEGMTNKHVRSLLAHGGVLLATTEGGVFRSNSSDISWIQTGLPNMRIGSLAINEINLFAGTDKGLFRSSVNGTNWTQISLGTITYVQSLAIDGSNVFVGTGDGLLSSTDNGANWSLRGLAGRSILALAVSGRTLFVGTTNGFLSSTDGGTGWVEVDSGLTWKNVYSLAVKPGSPGGTTFIAGVGGCGWHGPCRGGVFIRSESNTIWTSIGLSGHPVASVSLVPYGTGETNIFAVTSGKVYFSVGNDTTWTLADSGMTNLTVSCVTVSGTNIFAGTDGGVYLSTDNGISWIAVNAGLTDTDISGLAVSGNSLYAGTSRSGMWQRSLTEMITAVQLDKKGVPVAFQLQQNYPNPFNPSTTIKFELPTSSHVSLNVYDMLGREVAMLVNEKYDAGVHEVKFDGSALASGMYFYRLQAGSYVNTKKLLILR